MPPAFQNEEKQLAGLTRERALHLTETERQRLWAYLTEHVEQVDDFRSPVYDGAVALMTTSGAYPPEFQQAALEKGVLYQNLVYYHAPEDVAVRLAELALHGDLTTQRGAMEALAMQGGETALKTFLTLEHYPDTWKQKLAAPEFAPVIVSMYAQTGGWTFDRAGRRRSLIFDTCRPLVPGTAPDPAVTVGRAREDLCPRCGKPMSNLLALDGRDPRLSFLGLDGLFTASCCMDCVCWYPSFSTFTLDGGSRPLAPKEPEPYMGHGWYGEPEQFALLVQEAAQKAPFTLGETAPSPLYLSKSWESVSGVGGFANWIDDVDYPLCPTCGTPMKYLAQIHLDEWCEGQFYICCCLDCQTASVTYQQT